MAISRESEGTHIFSVMSQKLKWPFIIAAVCLLVGFGAGWFLRTPQVRVVESVKTLETRHEVQTTQQNINLDELRKIVTDASLKKNVITTREVIYAKDGTRTERTRTEDKSETTTKKAAETQTEAKSSTSTKSDIVATRVEERIKIVESLRRPDWLFTVGAGVGVPALFGSVTPSLVPGLPKQIYVNSSVSRRLLGPIYGGVQGSTRGDVGLQLGLVF